MPIQPAGRPADDHRPLTRVDPRAAPTATDGAVAAVLVPRGSWVVDAERSSVAFEVRHLGLMRVRGAFTSFRGRLESGTELRIDGSVDVQSIETGDAVRDGRLRSEFFDAGSYPTMGFTTDRAVPDADGWRVEGDLTIRGVTRRLVLQASSAQVTGGGPGVRARGTLSRQEFGLDWDALAEAGRLLVSDRVTVLVDVVLVPAAS